MKNLGTVVAVVAVILGIVGIVTGLSAKKASDELQTQIAGIQSRTDAAASDVEGVRNNLNKLVESVNQALRVRDDRLLAVEQRLTKPPPPAEDPKKGAADATKGKDLSAAKSPGRGGEHTIAAGETFEKIAKKYGVTTQAMIDANPDVSPERMKVGQKVRIP